MLIGKGNSKDTTVYHDGDKFDLVGRWVSFFVGSQHVLEAEVHFIVGVHHMGIGYAQHCQEHLGN